MPVYYYREHPFIHLEMIFSETRSAVFFVLSLSIRIQSRLRESYHSDSDDKHTRKEVTMPYVLVRHKVADYTKWKQGFDQNKDRRKAGGTRGGKILRNAHDPSEHIMLFEVDDLEKARQELQSEDLRQAMQRNGVIDKPDIYYLEEIEPLVM